MSTLSERITLLIESKGLKMASFERELGLKRNSISQILRRNTEIKADIVAKILETFSDVSAEWLLLGKGNMSQLDESGEVTVDHSFSKLHLVKKEHIISYLEKHEEEFYQLESFVRYKNNMIKDGVVDELIKRLKRAEQ